MASLALAGVLVAVSRSAVGILVAVSAVLDLLGAPLVLAVASLTLGGSSAWCKQGSWVDCGDADGPFLPAETRPTAVVLVAEGTIWSLLCATVVVAEVVELLVALGLR